jgi:large subunit ribosomal protein L4e
MAKVPVYDLKGASQGDIELPAAFKTPVRPDVIRKAISVAQSNRRQRYGASPWAGMMHSTYGAGKGRGMSRVPRIQGSGTASLAPPTVGGRRAHPPEARRDWSEKMNAKERKLAVRSGLAATAVRDLVARRGHKVGDKTALPLVVADGLEDVAQTKEVRAVLEKLGLADELARAEAGVRVRPGVGKLRGRRYKSPVSVLLVATKTDKLRRGASNLVGVQVTTPARLNAELLAPGGEPGRLTVFTQAALKQLEAF